MRVRPVHTFLMILSQYTPAKLGNGSQGAQAGEWLALFAET